MKRLIITGLLIAAVLLPAHRSYSEEPENGADKRLATLMESMRDTDPIVRRNVAQSLGEAAAAEAVPLLIDVLGSDPDVNVRLASLGALQQIGDGSAVTAYEKALKDDDPRVRECAAGALSGLWGESVHKTLVTALKEEKSARVRRSVAEALGNPGVLGRFKAHFWDSTEVTQKALVEALKYDEDYGVRATAARMLGKFKNAASLKALTQALEKDESLSVKTAVMDALGELDMPGAIPPLVDVINFERDDALIMSALRALKYYDDPAIPEAALSALDSASARVRWQAIDVLEESRNLDAVEPLGRIADDEYEPEGVRSKATEALQMMGVQ